MFFQNKISKSEELRGNLLYRNQGQDCFFCRRLYFQDGRFLIHFHFLPHRGAESFNFIEEALC